MSDTIETAEELDALPEGESVVQTLGGLWIKGEGANWHRPLRSGGTKVRSSAYLEQVGHLTLIWPRTDAALIEEAACRGMSVMDAAEAARLRGVAEGVEKLIARAESESWVVFGGERVPGPVLVSSLRALLHDDIESEA